MPLTKQTSRHDEADTSSAAAAREPGLAARVNGLVLGGDIYACSGCAERCSDRRQHPMPRSCQRGAALASSNARETWAYAQTFHRVYCDLLDATAGDAVARYRPAADGIPQRR